MISASPPARCAGPGPSVDSGVYSVVRRRRRATTRPTRFRARFELANSISCPNEPLAQSRYHARAEVEIRDRPASGRRIDRRAILTGCRFRDSNSILSSTAATLSLLGHPRPGKATFPRRKPPAWRTSSTTARRKKWRVPLANADMPARKPRQGPLPSAQPSAIGLPPGMSRVELIFIVARHGDQCLTDFRAMNIKGWREPMPSRRQVNVTAALSNLADALDWRACLETRRAASRALRGRRPQSGHGLLTSTRPHIEPRTSMQMAILSIIADNVFHIYHNILPFFSSI